MPARASTARMIWLAEAWRRMASVHHDIDVRIARLVGPRRMARMQTCTRDLPAFRFVDVARAAAAEAAARAPLTVIASEHPSEDLKDILTGARPRYVSRRINAATREAWPVAHGALEYLPRDTVWVAGTRDETRVLRVLHRSQQDRVVLEVAAARAGDAEALLTAILARADRASIYRGRLLSIACEAGVKDEYGDVERAERLTVSFHPEEPLADEDFVVDDDLREVLRRNVVDLHRRRDVLKAHGVPVRRGVLLYGPPGTGKTFACRYLCGQLPGVTRFVVAGASLLQVRSVFNLARLLQPSLVVLEDVDLVFAARELTANGAGLGELLDQMDGLRPFEDIGIVLTTNAIDRLEAAIRDRPGRISQCIHVGPPNDALRRRYLHKHLRRYPLTGVDLDELVELARGTTQAFLKEWVHRAVQIALEAVPDTGGAPGDLPLSTDAFRIALAEMRRDGDPAAARIIGFGTA